ncbi:COP23 domain-containing protein [Crocosphaera watsonii]|uniref:Uncharacterized protein n=3 Tax=Crocosphaera watsonii TaxID=263511 RepID=T2JNA2_CROWT|nr:COP23 domain-containing protein [Crocosphaera watsonii]EHJ09274.1 hypothetical protein CWATWH0003_B295 [Crocosphaera watsonii WH 0003]CCQ55034.1 hypothetical protein CWATWH0005_4320 [Crocosphaera watsonii WH 0005]CCQ66027.1 hypothetical protein CWATWH0402_1539 [Crocosphaera watsonii WH 0402]
MSFSKLIQGLTISSLVLTSSLTMNIAPSSSQSNNSDKVKFFCGETFDRASEEKIPATLVWIPQRQEHLRIIGWKSQYFYKEMTTEKRCQVVSEKFQNKYERGDLNYISFGENNGYPILCGVSNVGDPCDGDSQLFTLKHHADPKVIHTRLSQVLSGESSDMLMQSSGTQAYISFEKLLENMPVVDPVNNN